MANKKVKFTFFCIGPGETSQAVSLAQYAFKKGVDCTFVIDNLSSALWAQKQGFKKIIAIGSKPKRVTKGVDEGYNAEKIMRIIELENPDVLILCNSKAYSWGFIKRAPKRKPLIISLDSNWLFGQYPDVKMPSWIDKFLVTFPEEVFKKGLKQYGGYYEIEKRYLRKIIPAGFIPSKKISETEKEKIRKKFLVKKREKMIFVYTGSEISYRGSILRKIFKSLDFLYKKGYKFKVVYTAQEEKKRPWAIFAKDFLSVPDNFTKALASSDLAILHQGLITLFQAIANQVPVISNIPPKGKYHSGKHHTSFYEIKTFERLNACKAVFRNLPWTYLKNEIDIMLTDKKVITEIKKSQERIFKPGEKNAFSTIINLQKKRNYLDYEKR